MSDNVIVDRLAVMQPDWADVTRRSQRLRKQHSRRQGLLVVAGVLIAALAAVMIATPAWALVRDVLPFWGQPSAPSSAKVVFSHMNRVPRGTPAGMSPQAVSGDAREIERATIGGETKTLWVAPATGRFDFCWIWGPELMGSCGRSAQPLGVGFTTIPPHDPSQPARTTNIPANSGYPENGVPLWVVGSAISPTVSDVVIRFSDGSSVRPRIVWVSAPINAGFFAYDIPADQQSSKDHATEVDSYDQNGKLVSKQTITGG